MSCCNCLKIQVVSEIVGVPNHLLINGKLYLDLSVEFAFELSKGLPELTELDRIRDEASLASSLPYSPVNNVVADILKNHNRLSNQYEPIDVIVSEGGTTYQLNRLEFISADDASQTYEIKLLRSASHWLTLANKTLLRDIDQFEDFEFTPSNVADTWTNNISYSDGDNAIAFPLIYYGGWLSSSSMYVEDFRVWFHILGILQKGFCEIGWEFKSPFFESDYGRKLIGYLTGKDYGQNETLQESRMFRAHIESSSQINALGQIIFNVEDLDNGNNYDETTGIFAGAGIHDFISLIEISNFGLDTSVQSVQFVISVVRENSDGSTEVVQSETISVGSQVTARLEIKAENVSVFAGQKVYIHVSGSGVGFVGSISGFFYNVPNRVFLQRGDIFDPRTFLSGEKTFLDFFKGIVHLIKGKIETDFLLKRVTLYTPYDTTVFDEDIEGFYQDTIVDLSNNILTESESVSLERTERKRRLIIQFADSNDAAIDKLNLLDTEPLYSKQVDRGENFEEGEPEFSKNPLFSPTLNDTIVQFPVIPPLIFNYDVELAHLVDNDQGEISFDVGFRILYYDDYVTQKFDDGSSGVVKYWRYEETIRDKVPFAYQKAITKIDRGSGMEDSEFQLVYGDGNLAGITDNDLYSIAWRFEILRQLFSTRAAFDVLFSASSYQSTNFRDLYRIYYQGRTIIARMIELSRTSCNRGGSRLLFRPEPFAADSSCEKIIEVEDEDARCPDQPNISIDIDVDGDTITATADNKGVNGDNGTILTDVWEYSTDGGDTWQAYTVGTPISGEGTVIFRRQVTFDGDCPKSVVTATGVFASKCDNNIDFDIAFDEGSNTAIATSNDDINSTIDTDSWIYEIDDNGSEIAYTEGQPVNGFTTLRFRRTVTFTNSCPDITIEKTIEVTSDDQCNNQPVIVFTEIESGTCVYDLSIGGTTTSEVFATNFFISMDNGSTFFEWDNNPIRGEQGKLKVRAVVYYSDGCSASTIEADCPNE